MLRLDEWWLEYYAGRGGVGYWKSGPRRCNECFWLVPDLDALLRKAG